MIDLVTVVFREELEILRVQAQSIDLFCRDLAVGSIYVIVNDDVEIADQIDPAWWGQMANQVRILNRLQFGIDAGPDGWVSQQALKLLAAQQATADWSMILDAKSVFVRPLHSNQIFAHDGRVHTEIQSLSNFWCHTKEFLDSMFDVDFRGDSGIVPCLFSTKLVKELITYVETLTSQQFSSWFCQQPSQYLNEIALYFAYVQRTYKDLAGYTTGYSGISRVCIFRHDMDQLVDKFDQIFLTAKLPYVDVVMIHRHAWQKLDSSRRQHYRNFLVQRGITIAGSLE